MPLGANLQERAPENCSPEESRRALGAIEHDRMEVAKMLHDTACQSLSGLQLLGGTLLLLQGNQNGASEDVGAGLNDLVILLRRASAELRAVVDFLLPKAMRPGGLVVSLVEFCTDASERIPCEFHCDDRRAEIDPGVAEQFYQIAQAVVMAVVQRGAATRIEISLEIQSSKKPSVSIWNDAVPIVEESENERVPFNVDLLELRARAIGGRLIVTAPDTGGTRITCRVDRRCDSVEPHGVNAQGLPPASPRWTRGVP